MIDSEQHQSIVNALSTWSREAVTKQVADAAALREQFVARFPVSAWPTMPVEDYALGQGNNDVVSYWLEFKTRPVASMSGGSAHKHLIFFRRAKGVWAYPNEYSSVEQAWTAVRTGFVEILNLASDGQFDKADDVKVLTGAQAARVKLLYLHFPEDLVPVTSKEAIDHFLQALGESPLPTVIRANRQLLAALRAVPELAALSTQELGYFLYHCNDPRPSTKAVKIAPGELAKFWDDCRDNSYICVGWDEVGDLTLFDSKEDFRDVFREHYPYKGSETAVSRKANELWTLRELQPGDKVIANRGTSEILAIGTVTEAGYQWRPERQEYRHTVAVDWDTAFAREIPPVKPWATTTVSDVPPKLYRAILGTPAEATPPPGTPVAQEPIYRNIRDALKRRGQVVLYGPPGTGKTYTARRAAVWLLDGEGSNDRDAQLLSDDAALAEREKQLSSGGAQSRRMWFVVANPAQWAWSRLFTDGTVEYRYGRLKRNYPDVRAGDLVVGYESTPSKRIVALARVTGEYDPEDAPTITLEPIAPVDNGLTYDELQCDPVLSQSEPMQFRCQGTLFALSPVEADHLLSLLGERDPRITAVAAPSVAQLTTITFHPSYAYEDFIEGFRPKQSPGGTMALELVDGAFKRICRAAEANPNQRYVVIIDEINRGNIPKIFGELITVIENDKRGLTVQLPQSAESFAVPPNVWIIGTMNTADRSVQLLDTALRRRFAFLELLPEADKFAGATAGALALDTFFEELNRRIRQRFGREKQIGHAMFLSIDTPEAFASMFHYELLPLLQEYLYDDYTELGSLLGDVIDTDSQRIASDVAEDPEALCAKLAVKFEASASA